MIIWQSTLTKISKACSAVLCDVKRCACAYVYTYVCARITRVHVRMRVIDRYASMHCGMPRVGHENSSLGRCDYAENSSLHDYGKSTNYWLVSRAVKTGPQDSAMMRSPASQWVRVIYIVIDIIIANFSSETSWMRIFQLLVAFFLL